MRIPSTLTTTSEEQPTFGWVDIVVLLGVFGLLWSVMHFGRGMMVHFDESMVPKLSMDAWDIPYYAGRTLLRMWIAFGFSLGFTIIVGYAAAKIPLARSIILPTLDVLQSVPVLGFLSATVAGFMALFPGSLLGVECASIFAIFTSQVWNMTFGFYHSLVSIPTDMREVSHTYGLNPLQRFSTMEVPASMHSLIWNSMMSFGGGWFFVVQSEAITVMNKDIKLPGLGSYMATAIDLGDHKAAIWAIIAMVTVILISDQLVWRPLLAWADNFKIENTESEEAPSSWLYNLLRGAYIFTWIKDHLWLPFVDEIRRAWWKLMPLKQNPIYHKRKRSRLVIRSIVLILCLWTGWQLLEGVIGGVKTVQAHVSFKELLHISWLGVLTLGRVIAMTILATLIWTPIGVWIGFHPKVARFTQPLAQIAASFPVNMTYPFVVGIFVAWSIPMNWGSILLIAMGTQWYILFNVIAGAMAIPNELKEVARTYGLRGWHRWLTLILPAIFPFWVTGACTAVGGAWNASIVAELATWGHTSLRAEGLGAFISEVTIQGNTPLIISSIVIMSLFVVIINNLVWKRLYRLAEQRFRLI